MITEVLLRELNQKTTVLITNREKPKVNKETVLKWQKIVNNVAQIFEVPAGLIMKITKDNMEVFLKSENEENPYPPDGKDSLGHGLYCETVIGMNKELVIDNARYYEEWKDNPDVKLNMIAYYGLPLKWKDGETFGTICALDSKTNRFDMKYRLYLQLMKNIIEDDLEFLIVNQKLKEITIKDELTNIYNRRYIMDYLNRLLEEYKRFNREFSIILFDVDNFKSVNDTHGHLVGDEVLKTISEVISENIRKVDVFSRFGGDEFLMLCRETECETTKTIGDKLVTAFRNDDRLTPFDIDLSYGSACNVEEEDIESLIRKADERLYKMKKNKN